jgi:selenocysteine lyase/cysteine desulfurase
MKSGEIDGYDAVFLSPHKFVGGPGTPGILVMNKALYRLNAQPPSTCGGGTVAYVNGFNEEVRQQPVRCIQLILSSWKKNKTLTRIVLNI